MKIITMMIVFLIAVSANASTNLNWCLEYMTTNYAGSTWMLQDDSNGLGVYIKNWNSGLAKPTLPNAYAVFPQASIWKSNQVAVSKSDIDAWKDRQIDGDTLAKALKAMVICINKRLPATNKITVVEFKGELKDLLNQ